MGCGMSTKRGAISSGMFGQRQIVCPELQQDAHEELGVTLVACSLKGWRKTQEDTSSIVINLGGKKDMLGVGVFDGHSGPEASRYVAANLWNEVTKTSEWAERNLEGALKAAFLVIDENMRIAKVLHGTTAVVAVVTPDHLYVANCGDSRGVLCRGGVATAMSIDHKPCVSTEMARILRCGGQVMTGEFGGVSRVTAPGAMVAMATSRSLGDFHFKRSYNSEPGEQVVSPAAEVTCQRREEGDEFLVLGTDGVWDVLSNQEVSDMLRVADRSRRPLPNDYLMAPSARREAPGSGSQSRPGIEQRPSALRGGKLPSPAGGTGHPLCASASTAAVEATAAPDGRTRRSFSWSMCPPALVRHSTRNLLRVITPISRYPANARARGEARDRRAARDEARVEAAGSPRVEERQRRPEMEEDTMEARGSPSAAHGRHLQTLESGGAEGGGCGSGSAAVADEVVTAVEGDRVVEGTTNAEDGATVAARVEGRVLVDEGDSAEASASEPGLASSQESEDDAASRASGVGWRRDVRDSAGVVNALGGSRRLELETVITLKNGLSDSETDNHSDSGMDGDIDSDCRSSRQNSDSDSHFDGSEFGGGRRAIADFLSLQKDSLNHDMHTSSAASPVTKGVITSLSVGGCVVEDAAPPSSVGSLPSPEVLHAKSECYNDGIDVPPLQLLSASASLLGPTLSPAPALPASTASSCGDVDSSDGSNGEDEARSLKGAGGVKADASKTEAVADMKDAAHSAVAKLGGRQTQPYAGAAVSSAVARNEESSDIVSGEGREGVSADPGKVAGTSPSPPQDQQKDVQPPSRPSSSSGAAVMGRNHTSGVTVADVTLNARNTSVPWNTPLRYLRTPGSVDGGASSNDSNNNSGSVSKVPSLRASPLMYRSFRTPALGAMATPGGRLSSNGETPNSRGGRISSGGEKSSTGSSHRRSGSSVGLFQRSTGSSMSLSSMTGKEIKGVKGAVRGVLDRALQLGSQDNMTMIVVDLRGFLDPSPPPSTSSVQ